MDYILYPPIQEAVRTTRHRTMAKSTLSSEYISDSDSDSEVEQVFKAPKDFKKCDHLKKFPVDKLTKKSEEELWLINVPASLDVSKLETLPIDFNRTSSIQVEKQSYEIEQQKNGDNSNLVVMVPNAKRDALQILTKEDAPFQFDKIFTISESTDVPEIDYKKVRTPRENVPVVEGLIARHFATGYDAKDFGVTETAPVAKKVVEEKKVDTDDSKKRHHHDEEDDESSSKKSKKDKKEKKDKKHKKDKKDKKHKKDHK